MRRLPVIQLKPGKEKPVLRHHPWLFSGAVQRMDDCEPGGLVEVRAADGRFLARGYANPRSKILGRLLSFDEAETIDADFFARRVAAAVARRQSLRALRHPDDDATRLVMSEADGLPGLIVDQYGEWLVVQALTAGIDRQLALVVGALDRAVKARGIYERSDDAVRELEGLPLVNRALNGAEPPAEGVVIHENGVRFQVDVGHGHKTGFYLDQRQNHRYAQELVRAHRDGAGEAPRVLDAFCYTGGFTLATLAAGAGHVVAMDASEPALTRLAANAALSALDTGRIERRQGNAFELLRAAREAGERYDLISLDPPKFAQHAGQVDKAARGYKDLNLIAFQLLKPGGVLLTFSCSGHVSPDLYQKIVFGAASDAGVEAQILAHLFQADDHPVLLSFPESLYLKGLACRRL